MQVARDRAERLDEDRLAPELVHQHEVRGEGKGVEERKDEEYRVVLVQVRVKRLHRAANVRDEVRVREHRALRLAGRAGRVEDRGDVVGSGDVRVIPRPAPRDAQLLVRDNVDAAVDLLAVVDGAVNDDDAAERRKALRDREHHLEMGLVGRDDTDLGVLEDVRNLVVVKLRVDRDDRRARADLREIRLHPGRRVAEDDCPVFLVRLEPEGASVALRDFTHALEVFGPRAVLPHLVLAPGKGDGIGPIRGRTFQESSDCHGTSSCWRPRLTARHPRILE